MALYKNDNKTCPVDGISLRKHMTKQGLEIDFCPKCKGIWLDRGEIFHFTSRPKNIHRLLRDGINTSVPSRLKSPVTGKAMSELPLFNGTLKIERCNQTGGLWLDKDELKKMITESETGLKISLSDKKPGPAAGDGAKLKSISSKPAALLRLPSLGLRSFSIMVFLYSIVGLALLTLVEFYGLELYYAVIIGVGFAIIQFIISPFIMDLTLKWFYSFHEAKPGELGKPVEDFIKSVCKKEKMNYPSMGIIEDGAPNAFTYGHSPDNARIVITRGLFDLLDTDELNAVIAHELGHARNWDILIMTIASLAPLILYYIYKTLSKARAKKKAELIRIALVIGAYLLYIISEYVVLWFSRTREYYADRYSGMVTRNPSLLASALVKIGYGLAGREADDRGRTGAGEKKEHNPALEAIGSMGIFDNRAAHVLAIVSANISSLKSHKKDVDKELIKKTARWDLWNPWASLYEINSTHPLIAKRIQHLSNYASVLGMEPYIEFDEEKPESFWDEFLVDLSGMLLPSFAIIGSTALYLINQIPANIGFGLTITGLAFLIAFFMTYRTREFNEYNIATLLASVKVSGIRPVPCILKGKIIGKGVPGLIWSEDFVMQDNTGIIFLDYTQPLKIWQWIFGLLEAEKYQGKQVTIKGWYRRSPMPYVELWSIESDSKIRTCYSYYAKLIICLAMIASGIYVLFMNLINPGIHL